MSRFLTDIFSRYSLAACCLVLGTESELCRWRQGWHLWGWGHQAEKGSRLGLQGASEVRVAWGFPGQMGPPLRCASSVPRGRPPLCNPPHHHACLLRGTATGLLCRNPAGATCRERGAVSEGAQQAKRPTAWQRQASCREASGRLQGQGGHAPWLRVREPTGAKSCHCCSRYLSPCMLYKRVTRRNAGALVAPGPAGSAVMCSNYHGSAGEALLSDGRHAARFPGLQDASWPAAGIPAQRQPAAVG